MSSQGLFQRIQRLYDSLSGSRRKLAEHLLEHWDEAAFLTAAQLGEAAGVSETVVIRFATLLGYESYPDFKTELQAIVRRRLNSVQVQRLQAVEAPSEPGGVAQLAIKYALENVHAVLQQNSLEAFVEAAHMILKARTIYVLGLRASAGPARILAINLGQALNNVRFLSLEVGTLVDQLRHIESDDLLITFSFARHSLYAEQAAAFAMDRGARHIAITDDRLSPSGRLSTIALLVSWRSGAFGLSHTGTAALIDVILSLVGQFGDKRVRRSLGEAEELMTEYSPWKWAERRHSVPAPEEGS